MRDNRYSIGGGTGDKALYNSIGDNAVQTVLAETGKTADELIISTKEVKLNKVLDLRDPEVRSQLGISDVELLTMKRAENGAAYDLTQIIGNIAQKNGFDAIIAPSAENKVGQGINLIIFERALQ